MMCDTHALLCSCSPCAYKSGLVCSLSFMYDNGVLYTQTAVYKMIFIMLQGINPFFPIMTKFASKLHISRREHCCVVSYEVFTRQF